jgi:hypothetical protein
MLSAWVLVTSFARAQVAPAPPSEVPEGGPLLWYNGDFDGVDGLANEQDTDLGSELYAHTYDDVDVTDQSGWDVGAVFSNNFTDTKIIGATWEIRQGITPGNGAKLIASGMTTTPVVTATVEAGLATEYTVEVDGIVVYLRVGNSYFLNVTPIGDLSGRSFVSTTSGANAVGQPPGDNQNACFDSNIFGARAGEISVKLELRLPGNRSADEACAIHIAIVRANRPLSA